jgi:hypothetical protein
MAASKEQVFSEIGHKDWMIGARNGPPLARYPRRHFSSELTSRLWNTRGG